MTRLAFVDFELWSTSAAKRRLGRGGKTFRTCRRNWSPARCRQVASVLG
jgi:hypothetical protein